MKKSIAILAMLFVAAQSFAQGPGRPGMGQRPTPVSDPEFDKTVGVTQPIPDAIRKPAAKQGTMEEFKYTANRRGEQMQRHAMVYLPYGYNKADKKAKYNVVYLMHGGGDNIHSFLTPPQDWLPLHQVLDHLIADGKMKPVIVICPSFYDDDENIGANRMDDATKMCCEFYKELEEALIPAAETTYNTYLTGKDIKSIEKTREHRAFGGFSMGALCTWYTLAYGVNAVKTFIPLSGDIWTYDDNGQRKSFDESAEWINSELAKSPFSKDFIVYGWSGTRDMAGNPQKSVIRSLRDKAPLFRYGTPDANLFFSMKEGGEHFYGHINEYLYHCLPMIWK